MITAIFLNCFIFNISNFQSIVLNLINLTSIYYNKLNYLINKKIHKISRSINHTFKMILFFQVQYHEHYGSLIKMTVKKTGIGKKLKRIT